MSKVTSHSAMQLFKKNLFWISITTIWATNVSKAGGLNWSKSDCLKNVRIANDQNKKNGAMT